MVMMMMMIFVCHNERSYDTNTWTLFNRHKSVDPHLRTMLSICDFSELFVCMWNRCLFPFYLIASNFNDFHLNFCDTLKCDLFDQLFLFYYSSFPSVALSFYLHSVRVTFNIVQLPHHILCIQTKHPLVNVFLLAIHYWLTSVIASILFYCMIELMPYKLVLSKKFIKGDDL